MSLIRLVYASTSRLVEANRREELGAIIATAQRLNASNGVTGFLMVTPGAFAQVLEGERDWVEETYARIEVDPRHHQLRVLSKDPVLARRFTDWSMGLAERDETTAFIFGLYGVGPDDDLPKQPADALLDLAGELSRMRA